MYIYLEIMKYTLFLCKGIMLLQNKLMCRNINLENK